jgi:uncharacterized protein
MVAAPGYTSYADYEDLLEHCERLMDRVAVLDGPTTIDNIEGLARAGSASGAGAAGGGDAGGDSSARGVAPRASAYGAFYFPHIIIVDPLSGEQTTAPPSGHVAGIYARTDATRGVHKAPANEVVRGALGMTYDVTREEQKLLNSEGVNCIRRFPQGILVWGARTLDRGLWRYLNVRRFFNMVKESIEECTHWIVFEPNDEVLWSDIRRDVRAFLMGQWRSGALVGRTPEEAFFVKCDAETNPPEDVDQGLVNVEIGMAPSKPAEFIIFRISQARPGAEP